jgi:two-component system, chemotaxis family, CheB/CheR fusion protein
VAKRDNRVTASVPKGAAVDVTQEGPGGFLVVVGSSAGGIDALSVLVSTLTKDFPAPIVVAQHLDPRRPSHLAEILARRTELPVVTVEDRAELTPGSIFVVPANSQIEVTDHEVRLSHPSDARPMPSVDRVLTTAAGVFGEQLIAVILTGTGSDGAEGARQVKANGGTVIIQDPATAQFPSMPASLAPTSVDIVAPIDAIGPLLHELVSGAHTPSLPDEERLLSTFLDDLRGRTGIDFGAYKRPTILRRLQRRMAATRTERLRDYLRFAAKHPEEYQRLTSSFLIKVTEFFRDPELFDQLRDEILPQIIAEARENGREVRLWSAGCATGEEAYSLAILVHEAIGGEIDEWTVRVFATDLDGDAVAFARRGVYPAASFRHLPPELVARHFSKLDGEHEVRSQIRALVVFGQHDLALRAPFPRIDLVLCRNVLIYFTAELQRRALQLFAFSLRNGGWLALGKAETTSPLAAHFLVEDARLKIFRRHGERALIPPFRLRDPATIAAMAGRKARLPIAATLAAVDPEPRPRPSIKAEISLAALPVGVLLVNASYDIETINPTARRVLGIHGPAIGQDLIHLVSGLPTDQLRAAIDEALAGRTGTATVPVIGSAPGDGRLLEVTSRPVHDEPGVGKPVGAVIVVRDVTADQARVAAADATVRSEPVEAERMAAQMESVRETSRRIAAANDELTASNADLRSANEDLQVATEEVQAATEEVETLNEELQATNEELETLNEELQATVEELNTTNDDVQARSVELQEMTVDLEAQRRTAETERARMMTLIGSLNDGVLVVDRAGHTVLRNQAFVRMFEAEGIEPVDQDGRAVGLAELRERTARGESFEFAFNSPDRDGRERWFEVVGRPVPAEMGIGEGGTLIVHDTTDVSLRRLQEEFVGIVAHELRTPLTALRGYLQMLNRHVSEPEAVGPPMLPLAIEQADRLHQLVDELFDVTLAGRGGLAVQPALVALGPLVRETVDVAQGLADGHEFRIEEPDGELLVLADRARLQQVLLNLLTNALIHAADSPDVAIRLRRLRRWAEIDIEDHGPGILPDVQARLFSRFERGGGIQRRGLGLGLYISREIVNAHGGTIEVDSQPGYGTTFTIRLPLASRTAPATPKPPSADGNDGAGGTNGRNGTRQTRVPASPPKSRRQGD